MLARPAPRVLKCHSSADPRPEPHPRIPRERYHGTRSWLWLMVLLLMWNGGEKACLSGLIGIVCVAMQRRFLAVPGFNNPRCARRMNIPCVRTGQAFNPCVDIDEIVCDVIRRRCEVFYGVTGNAIGIASGILV